MLKKIANNFLTVRDIDFYPSASEYNVRVAASNGICARFVAPVRALWLSIGIFEKFAIVLKCGGI